MASHLNLKKVSAAGLLIALGIIYGDIGTSPLYVFNEILKDKLVDETLVIGGLSCVIWTLTLQTTIKYVLFTLKADNNGEGGIFSLYALVRRQKKWLVIPAMIGGAALLADGMITPPISVTSSIEGLRQLHAFQDITGSTIVFIVIIIISLLFFMQQFGTASIGKMFGPLMLIWFLMLAVLGALHISDDWSILKAFNPFYAFKLLTSSHQTIHGAHVAYTKGFWILGAIFLCTTGAEALYSDLGHVGRSNIRYSWVFVKITLIVNYLGQGAWLLAHHKGHVISDALIGSGFNPFYGVMPQQFKIIGVVIATLAAIIASQALISGSFTLISESMRLNLWPKMKINYPTEAKGQLYIPAINTLLFVGCIGITLYFQSSTKMAAAYGLAITLCMLATSILFANYLVSRRVSPLFIYTYLFIYVGIEISFLIANLEKFPQGGYVTLVVGGFLFAIMYVWYRSRKIKNRYVEFVKMEDHMHQLQDLSNDNSIPKFATHLVYLTSANNPKEIEHKIIYSILNKKPKRADLYWFIHVDVVDEPYKTEYVIDTIIPNEIIRVEFRLGFREEQRINLMFRKVVEDMVKNKEVNITSRYTSLQKNKVAGDWQFIVMEKFLSHDNDLPLIERLIMRFYFMIKKFGLSEEKGFGLDSSYVTVEKYPLVVAPVSNLKMVRIEKDNL